MTRFRWAAATAALTLALPGLALAQPWSDPPARRPVRLAEVAPAAVAEARAETKVETKVETKSGTETGAAAPVQAAAADPVRPVPAAGSSAGSVPKTAPGAPARAEAPRPRRAARAPVRAARYAGGAGAVWQAGDGHAFSGSFGGCRVTGFAGPGGFRLVRGC